MPVAIITGADSGIGRATAVILAERGWDVGITYLSDDEGAREAAQEIEGLGRHCEVRELDLDDAERVQPLVDEMIDALGGCDLFVNNAGMGVYSPFLEFELSDWRKVLDVNLTGQFLMARELAAWVVRNGVRDAVIVNLSSIARAGNPGQSNYAASKAGLDACTRTWALELARHGIRVGGVAPGVTETGFLEGFSEEALARLRAGIPLGRLGRPEDIWKAVRFILEDDFFTGRTVEVDGGAAMGFL